MSNIIIALPKLEDAKYISLVLRRHGIKTAYICDRASIALTYANHMQQTPSRYALLKTAEISTRIF